MSSNELTKIQGVGTTTAAKLRTQGLETIEQIASAPLAAIAAVPGFGAARAATIKRAAAAAMIEQQSAALGLGPRQHPASAKGTPASGRRADSSATAEVEPAHERPTVKAESAKRQPENGEGSKKTAAEKKKKKKKKDRKKKRGDERSEEKRRKKDKKRKKERDEKGRKKRKGKKKKKKK